MSDEPHTKWRYSYSGADVRVTAWFPHQVEGFSSAAGNVTDYTTKADALIEQQQGLLNDASIAISKELALEADIILRAAEALSADIVNAQDLAASYARSQQTFGPQPLESIHTVSISVHEPKGPARALGYRGIKGFASSVRTIAGSMIFTVVEGHPLEALMLRDVTGSKIPWSYDYAKGALGVGAIAGSAAYAAEDRTDIKLATLLSPFDMMMIYTSEIPRTVTSEGYTTITGAEISSQTVGTESIFGAQTLTKDVLTANRDIGKNLLGTTNSAALMLKGVRFMTEGIVTSVNDMVTEIVYQFVAEDMVELSQHHFGTKPLQQLTSTEQGIVMASMLTTIDGEDVEYYGATNSEWDLEEWDQFEAQLGEIIVDIDTGTSTPPGRT
tara:strand:+ start:605 stop:1759 length:1155 start_codon:yes stop_codon:yes gene_type:complete